MKIYLASYLEPKNQGPGKKYAITRTKPDSVSVDGAFTYLTPDQELLDNYDSEKNQDKVVAAKNFNDGFLNQLTLFKNIVTMTASDSDVGIESLLPFKDGDTLLSWERSGFTSYRPLVAECLKELGYEVILN